MKYMLAWMAFALSTSSSSAQEILFDEHGDYEYESAGSVLTSAGDVDGDGSIDVLLYRVLALGFQLRVVQLLSGSDGEELQTWPVGIHDDVVFDGLGDVDADGYGDVVIGLIESGVFSFRAYSGATGALLHERIDAGFGQYDRIRVRATGDVNGDGTPDYVTVEPAPGGGSLVRASSGLSGDEIYSVTTLAVGYVGLDLDVVGDLDGDGVTDWISGNALSAAAEVRSGVDGSLIHAHQEGMDLGRFGEVVAGVGFFDSDHVPDYAVGQPGWNWGRVWVYSGATGGLIRRILPAGGSSFPGTMAGIDVDGDGRSELVVGVDYGNLSIHGYDGLPIAGQLRFREPVERRIDQVARRQPGDFDGDGAEDLLVGSTQGPAGYYSGSALILSFNQDCDGNGQLDVTDYYLGGDDCNGNLVPDSCDISSGFSADLDADGVPDECSVPAGSSYCQLDTTDNSSGFEGRMYAWGAPSISQSSFHLIASRCPDNESGFFLLGPGTTVLPYGDGSLCVAQPMRLAPLQLSIYGTGAWPVDFGGSAASLIQPGETWHFQFWFRDPAAGGAGFNFTEGFSQLFAP